MIRKKEDVFTERHDHKFGGDGYIVVDSLNKNDQELNNKGRVFAHTTVMPGSAIGYHEHYGESEIYYILTGEGEFNDNGTLKPVKAGDVTYTFAGQGHGLKNTGKEPLEVIALILYA